MIGSNVQGGQDVEETRLLPDAVKEVKVAQDTDDEDADQIAEPEAEGKMPFYSAVFNLTHTIIGSGTLTLPHVFAKSGWLPANIIAVLIMVLTTYSVYLLVVASDRVGGRGARNFEGLGYKTCGVWGSVYAEATFIFGGLGTLTGYMIFIGKLMCQVTGLDTDSQRYIPILITVGGVIIPLTIFRRINALRYVSMVAILAILYITAMYVAFVARIGRYNDDPAGSYSYIGPKTATWSHESVDSLNLMIGAFCVQNTCLPVYGEMQNRSPRRIVLATMCAMAIAFVVYEIMGVCGYHLLGENVGGDSLLEFDDEFVDAHPWTNVWRDVAKVMMAGNLALVAPLAIWPFRSAACSVISRARAGCTGPARGSDFASATLFRSVTIVSLIIVSVMAITIPDVTIPFSVVNSLAGGSMIFVMPGLFYIYSLPEAERFSVRAAGSSWAMIVTGLAVAGLGFGLEVKNLKDKYG
eukprot:TRINITY_DN1940_c4_g1_i1.p1 TRINITY_DN1940_c4_g1~~TRINITY_DN1940_c4_g1_i1.p1  ORF type:complete len:467 (+),score=99.63 TRINITY_DN1940_c4_g1_i1:152-1552(+)